MKMDGDYPDEMILSALKAYEREVERERPLGYRIRILNKTVELSDREIYPGVRMRLPKYFGVKTGDEASSGYLMRHHPEIIFTSGDGSVNFTFDRIGGGDGRQIRREWIDLMEAKYPQNTVYDSGEGRLGEGGGEFCWFDYKSFAADSDVYNLLFLFPCEGETVIGTFKCAFRHYSEWKHYVLDMIATIQYKAEEVCTDEGLQAADHGTI